MIVESLLQKDRHRYYIHPVNDGTVLVTDIITKKYPHGLRLSGKDHFILIDEVGKGVLNESPFYQILLKKGKLEVVDQAYVNKHKSNRGDLGIISSEERAALDSLFDQAQAMPTSTDCAKHATGNE